MHTKKSSRRRFLEAGPALAGAVLVPLASGNGTPVSAQTPEAVTTPDVNSRESLRYGWRSRFVTTYRPIEGGDDHMSHRLMKPMPSRASVSTPLGESVGIITPNSLHYSTQHEYGVPDINPREHKLMIHGMVDRPLVFTMEELRRLPYVSRVYYIQCTASKATPTGRTVEATFGRTACSEWAGVPLSLLLREAGVQNGASWIVAEAVGGGKHAKSVPMAKAMEDVLVAYSQNGEPVRPDNGFPLRLFVPGFEGLYSVKWLHRIKVVDKPYLTFQEQRRYLDPRANQGHFNFEQGPISIITFPSGEQQLSKRGVWMITGLAWSGMGAVRRVEVSTNGGRTWAEAQLQDPVLKRAHTRFNFKWRWEGEEAMLLSRCIDELGQVQPTVEEFAKFWGIGIPQVYRTPVNYFGHANFIQPWNVLRDGSVRNGLAT
jgi:sulfane dehydrogenase subunit SoxC